MVPFRILGHRLTTDSLSALRSHVSEAPTSVTRDGSMNPLRFLLRFIATGQLFFGALFTVAPTQAATWFGLHPTAPGWANWLFFMLGARFIGYGVGMLVAARDPQGHLAWLNTMAAVQV